MQCAPAFNYARSTHITSIVDDDSVSVDPPQKKALFESDSLALDLRYIAEVVDGSIDSGILPPEIVLEFLDLSKKGHKGLAVQSKLTLEEGQCVTFVLRTPPTVMKVGSTDGEENSKAGAVAIRFGLDKMLHVGPSVDDPFLSKELLALLLHVCRSSGRDRRLTMLTLFNIRIRIGIGTNGSARILIRDRGKKRFCVVHSL